MTSLLLALALCACRSAPHDHEALPAASASAVPSASASAPSAPIDPPPAPKASSSSTPAHDPELPALFAKLDQGARGCGLPRKYSVESILADHAEYRFLRTSKAGKIEIQIITPNPEDFAVWPLVWAMWRGRAVGALFLIFHRTEDSWQVSNMFYSGEKGREWEEDKIYDSGLSDSWFFRGRPTRAELFEWAARSTWSDAGISSGRVCRGVWEPLFGEVPRAPVPILDPKSEEPKILWK